MFGKLPLQWLVLLFLLRIGFLARLSHHGQLISTANTPELYYPLIQFLMISNIFRCTTCGEYIYKGKKFNARKVGSNRVNVFIISIIICRLLFRYTVDTTQFCRRVLVPIALSSFSPWPQYLMMRLCWDS